MSLRITASGICCALGYHAQAASCALRAGMDHFRESDFVTHDGSPIRVARLDDNEHWGRHGWRYGPGMPSANASIPYLKRATNRSPW